MKSPKLLLTLGILISLIVRIAFISQSKHIADIYLMYTMGASFLNGHNPYLQLDFNSYPPLAIYLEAASMFISAFLHTSFVTIFKLWPNLADFISAILIYKFLLRLKHKPSSAALWTIFFLLNPISIIISAAHGQIDSITSLLVLLSIYFLTFYSKRRYIYISAVFLGIGIAFKANPVMLIPLFVCFKNNNLRQRLLFLILTLTPLLLSVLPFINNNPSLVFFRIISYSGVNDLSYAAILRGIWYQNNAITNIPLTADLLNVSKMIFLIGEILLLLLLTRVKNLAKACLTIYLLFLTTYFGIACQYLIWVIPLAIIARDKMIFYYTTFGFLTLVGFYLFFGPDILFGKFYLMQPYQTKYIYLYFFSNLVFWCFNLFWLIKIVLNQFKESFSILPLFRKRLIYFTAIFFILSIFPMLHLFTKFLQLYSLGE